MLICEMQSKNGNLLQTHFMAFQDYITLLYASLVYFDQHV